MKKIVILFAMAALATAAQASVLVYESFGDTASEGNSIAGYSGTSAEIGLKDTWSVTGGAEKLTVRFNHEYDGVSGGYTPETTGGAQHWWENDSWWWVSRAERSMSSSIDLTKDKTLYISFFIMSGDMDFVAQIGFNDGTNELMVGNGYNGTDKGLTAYYGAIDTSVTTNGNGTAATFDGGWNTGLLVARLVKSDSGVSDALAVDIKFYDITALSGVIDSSDPAAWDRSLILTGVTGVFDTLEMKIDGGGNYPSMDEVRIGQNWVDVTVGNVSAIAPDNGQELVAVNTDLSWVVRNNWSVDVYISGPYDESTANPELHLVDSDNSSEKYTLPSDLENDKWYYWRVDELEPNIPDPVIHTGAVWSFKTQPATPVFINGTPESITVATGDPASFSISAINHIITTWYHSTDAVTGQDSIVGTGDSLDLSSVRQNDEGWYYAIISNGNPAQAQVSAMAQLLTERLIAYWDFENGSLIDSVGGFAGVISDPNDPNIATGSGISGDGYEFFQDSIFIEIAGTEDYFNFYCQGMTANVWIKTPPGTGPWNGVISKRTQGPDDGWVLWAQQHGESDSGASFFEPGSSHFDTRNSGVDTAANDDVWHMITLTYNPETSVVAYYFDGEQAGMQTVDAAEFSGPDVPLVFGVGNSEGGRPFAGLIDEVRIYSFDIGDTGVLDLYNTYVDIDKVLCINPFNKALDIVKDCRIDILDFAELALGWLECGLYPVSACE